MLRRRWLLALLAGLALLTGACAQDSEEPGASPGGQTAECGTGDTEAAAKDGTVKLGFLGDITGANSGLITSLHKSVQLAIKQANASGDLPVEIELVSLDNKDGNPDPVPGLIQRLISDPQVIGLVGPGFSGETEVAGPLLCEAGLVHVSASATNPDLTKNGWTTFFRALSTDAVQGGATGDYIVEALEKTKVAVINDKSPYGAGLAKEVVADVKRAGGQVVLDEGIEPTTDYTSVIDSVIATDHEVLYYSGYDAQAPLVLKQYRDKGGEGIFMGGDGDKGANFLKEGGAATEGAILTCPCLDPNASDDPAAQKFASDYRAEYDGELAGIYSSEGWDVAQMFIDAVKDGGADVSRASVLEFIDGLEDYKGLSKTFNWTPEHEVEGAIYIYEVEDGKYVLLGEASELV